ncbi:Cof-type HAD-IIB family hydrolase [Salisediminibacterium selenitireducens]|uniref:Cof-like hydrolase n=1 Tax=Bacillus selenitireducens (strain ATCC 700615 / DSM 15326 / MLS10) TaxID=439292 RepID=D6XZQ5_BACIE|nr:Cof-type HAD-IIB family hydrolase [Salisediminibacterium selenitireducens]ADH98429.1 Cof-like hydrolase [[Bacillus] selenitireducens MLS10]
MVKAVALDMDGTLLDDQHQVSEELTALLRRWQGMGIRFFLATGRTAREAADVLPKQLKPDGIVGANGMVVMIDGKEIDAHEVPVPLTEALVDGARKRGIYYEIHPAEGPRVAFQEDRQILENETDFRIDTGVAAHEAKSREEAVANKIHWVDACPTERIIKIYFFHRKKKTMTAWKEEVEGLKERFSFTTSSSSEHNVEVMAAGVNKATGVETLLEHYGLDRSDLLAIGDANNDLPLLKMAGQAAVMQNGSEEVKRAIRDVTPKTNDENGVYDYLLQLEMKME